MSEIVRTSSSSSVSLNQNNSAPVSPRASAVDQFDANRTSSNARGNNGSKTANPSAASPYQGGYASPTQGTVTQAAPTTVQCAVPAPIVYHAPQRAEANGSNFTYQMGDIQLAPAAHQQTVQVPYYFGGNQHHIFPGNVVTGAQHSILVQPVITHERDTITVHNGHQALDQRSPLSVGQLDCQLVDAVAAQSPIQQSPVQSPAQYSPAKAGGYANQTQAPYPAPTPVPVPSTDTTPVPGPNTNPVPGPNMPPVSVPSSTATPVSTPASGL